MSKQHSEKFVKLVNDALTRVKEIDSEETAGLIQDGEEFSLIDVRETHEWKQGRIPGAVHLSKGVIEREIESVIPDKKRDIILYCGGGYRSALAADNLKKMGYKNVKSLAGGWRKWKEKDLPTES
ncbi:MAG TPA: rhodanese-like domain-containing protein [Balneolaceae bacterium]|nr:rhodanese-like domain-containing protein [Balneolaceae bacterium]